MGKTLVEPVTTSPTQYQDLEQARQRIAELEAELAQLRRGTLVNELVAAQENISAVINNTTDSIWSVGRDLKLITINEPFRAAFRAVYGFELHAGDYILEKLGPAEEAEWRDYYERALAGETFKVEKHFVYADVAFEVFSEISFNPIRSADAEIGGVAVYSRNITERKLAEKALHTREAQLSEVLSHVPMEVAMFDREMRYLHASLLWYTNYGLTDPDIIGKSHYEVFPEIGDDWKAIHQRGLAGEIHQSDRSAFLRADGSIQWLRWEVRPWYSAPGEVGGLLIYSENITERINAEDELRRSEALLQTTQRVAKIGGWEFQVASGDLTWTSETRVLAGVASDFQPNIDSVINLYAEEYRPVILDAVQQALQGKPFDLEVQMVSESGQKRWARTAGYAEFADGKPTKIYGVVQDIDERKRAENEIAARQQQLVSTSNNFPGAIFSIISSPGGAWSVGSISDGITPLSGVEPHEVVDSMQPFFDRIHPEDLGAFWDSVAPVTTQPGSEWRFEGRLIHRTTGQIKWWEGRAVSVQTPDGQVVFYGVLLDITQTREAEAKLRRSEAKLRRAEAVTHIGNFELDVHSGEGVWSDELYHLFGLEVGSPIGLRDFRFILPTDDVALLLRQLEDARRAETPYQVEQRALLPDGTTRYFYTIAEPIFDGAGQITTLFGTTQDITPRKAAEVEREALLAQTETLYEISQALNQAHSEAELVRCLGQRLSPYEVDIVTLVRIVQTSPDAPTTLELEITWSRDGSPIVAPGTRFPARVFPFVEALLLDPVEPRVFDVATDPQIDDATRKLLQSLNDQVLVNIPLYLSSYWVGMILLLWRQPYHPPPDAMTIFRALPALMSPIADNIQLVRHLEQTVEQLHQSVMFKDRFLATMSHELRTPMNAIMGYSSIALQRDGVPEPVRQMLQRVLVNSERLLRLISDILDISRINAGRVELVADPFPLHRLAAGWAQDFAKPIADKGLQFDFVLDATLPTTMIGDEERLSQIATNLLSNATKFTDLGKIGLYVTRADDRLVIQVTDTGIGIPQTYHHLIFEEFRQVDMTPERRYGGSGLGLAIVQKLCILMGGTVGLESEVGMGSTFTVTLPLQPAG